MCLFIRQNAQISINQGQENQIPQQINKNCGLTDIACFLFNIFSGYGCGDTLRLTNAYQR